MANGRGSSRANPANRYTIVLAVVALLVLIALATIFLPDQVPGGGTQALPSSSIVDPQTVPSGTTTTPPSP